MTRGWLAAAGIVLAGAGAAVGHWYDDSFYLLHEDHHTVGTAEVGRDADPAETARLVALSKPDMVQIHAKGNPGWTTYPSKVGHTPPKLARDVLGVWRDLARAGGCHWSVYYNIGRDGEIMKRRPEWNRSDADGAEVDRALCYHSGVGPGYLWPMIREIMAGYKPDGWWFDGSCFTIRPCYCDVCRTRFKRESGLEAPAKPGAPGWAAYQEMQRQIYREFIRDTAALIHRIDPNCLVAFNWACSLRMPEKPDAGIAYLTGDIGNRVAGLSPEAHWYDGVGLPFDLMTQLCTMVEKAGPDGRRVPAMVPKPAPQIEQEMAVIIANGGRYFLWDNPTRESGLVPERHAFLGRVVAPFLRARQRWCLGSRRVPEVSLLHSAAAHYAATDGVATSFTRPDNRIDGATAALARLHLNYEMVPDWRLADGDVNSPLLVVEHPKALTRKTIDALIGFVESGGDLFVTGMGIGLDKRLPGVFGLAGITPPKAAERLTVECGGDAHPMDHWLYRVRTAGAERLMEARDAAGAAHPLLTANRHGRGTAYYVAVPLLAQHGKNVVPHAVTQAVFDRVLPPRRRRVTTDAPETVEVVLRRQGAAAVLHLVNMAPGEREVIRTSTRTYTRIAHLPPVPACRVTVRLPARPAAVRLEPQAEAVAGWRFEDGRVHLGVPSFAVHQMIVFEAP